VQQGEDEDRYLDNTTESKNCTHGYGERKRSKSRLRIAKPSCEGLEVPFLFKRREHLGPRGVLLRRIPFPMGAERNGRKRGGGADGSQRCNDDRWAVATGRRTGVGRSGRRRVPQVRSGQVKRIPLLFV
jgi:hypothetical protein